MQNEGRGVRALTVGLLVVVGLMVASAGWALVSPIDLPFQRVDWSMHATSTVDGRTLHVTGTTNLPDGAFIDWDLWRESIDVNDWPSGHVAVQSGAFGFDADLTGWPSGPATAEVSFSCDWGTVQQKAVTDVAGEHCEHLGGDQVYVDSPGDPKQLATQVPFAVP